MAEGDKARPGILERLVTPAIERGVAREMEAQRDEMHAELIGRYVAGGAEVALYKSRFRAKTVDETIPDYEFWDHLRRGKAKGYALGGLFCEPIEWTFTTWVFGSGLTLKLAQGGDPDDQADPRNYTDLQLAGFVSDHYALLMHLYQEHLGLGDQYIIVNADGTLSVPSPDTVKENRDPLDYRKVTSVEVETRLEGYTITDEYRADGRTLTVKKGADVVQEQRYQNLIGRIPVVHVAHKRKANETHGHPIHERLLALYDEYDDLIYKQLDGAKLLGNPIPTFEGMENVKDVITQNEPMEQDTYTDKDGHTETRVQLMIDQNTIILVGKGGVFKFAAPPTGFTKDTKTALKSLFLLLLDHTGIPEFIWGGEMSAGRASTGNQLTQWVHHIEGRQRQSDEWLLELAAIWLAVRALVDRRLVVDELAAQWAPLLEEDEEMRLKEVEFAGDRDLLTDQTQLELLHLVSDPGREVKRAQEEADSRREALFPEGDTFGFQQRLGEEEAEEEE